MITQHPYMGSGGPCEYQFQDGLPCNAFAANHQVAPTAVATMSHGETVFLAYSEAVQRLVRTKDAAYGGAWQRQGYMGNLARIMSKAARLENMMWRDQEEPPAVQGAEYSMQADLDSETVLDTLKDLMALAAFMAANIEDGNRWGHGQ